MKIAHRFETIELSLIRQINALATPFSINLGIGEPNLEPDETLREMARAAATTSWHYSANAGTPALRQCIGDAFGYDGKSEVCVTAGTQEAIYAIFQAYVDPGDEVLIPDPGFLAYSAIARICGATPVPYPLEPPDWQLEAASIRSRITRKTKLIIVNSPSNPLGAVAGAQTLREIATLGPLVISDEVYREIWYGSEPASMAGMDDRVIIVNGLSKSHGMTGLRLAWVLADAGVLGPIVTAHQYIATCASVFSQALAERIFANRAWNAEWLPRMREQFATQREAALYAIEHELGAVVPPPDGAFYAFTPVPFCESVPFAKTLATDAAVLVIPGLAFGKRGEGFVRISFAATPEQIAGGVERMGRYLRASGR